MTQMPGPYPSPYQYPPGYGYDPMQALLAPARRAGLMMIILGSLMLAGGTCCGGVLMIPPEQFQIQLEQSSQQMGQTVSMEEVRAQLVFSTAILVGLGLPMLILGVVVRRGGSGAIIASIVLTSILILLSGISILGGLFQGADPVHTVGSACVGVVPLAIFVLLLVWLIQGLRAGATIRAMQMQYQSQYWQYAQQQQAYGAAQYQPPVNPNAQAPSPNQASNPDSPARPGDGGSLGPPPQQ